MVAVPRLDAPRVGTVGPQVLVAPEVVGRQVPKVPASEIAAAAPRTARSKAVARAAARLALRGAVVGGPDPTAAIPDVAVDAAIPKAVAVGGVAPKVVDVRPGPAAVAGAVDLDGAVVGADHAVAYVARPPIHAVVDAPGVPAEIVWAGPTGAATEVGLVHPVEVLPVEAKGLGWGPVVATAPGRAAHRAAAAAQARLADAMGVEAPVLDVVQGVPGQAGGRVVEARGAAPVVVHRAATADARVPTLSVLTVRVDAKRAAGEETVAVRTIGSVGRAGPVAAAVPVAAARTGPLSPARPGVA